MTRMARLAYDDLVFWLKRRDFPPHKVTPIVSEEDAYLCSFLITFEVEPTEQHKNTIPGKFYGYDLEYEIDIVERRYHFIGAV